MTFEKYHSVVNRDFDIISIYEDVISNKRKIFPHGTWYPQNGGYDNLRRCVRYLILDKLKLSKQEYLKSMKNGSKFLHKHRLRAGFDALFQCKVYKLNDYVFPEWSIKVWENNKVPDGYWNKETAVLATKWLFEDILNWEYKDIIDNISPTVFADHGLITMFRDVFDRSYYEILKETYPEKNWNPIFDNKDKFYRHGEFSSYAKFTKKQANDVRREFANGTTTQRTLAKKYNVTDRTISRILSGDSYKEE